MNVVNDRVLEITLIFLTFYVFGPLPAFMNMDATCQNSVTRDNRNASTEDGFDQDHFYP